MHLIVMVVIRSLVVVDRGSPVNGRLESVVVVSGVVHSADGAVGLHERVLALDHISVALLVLGLDVSGVVVIDSVLELVLGVGVVVDVLLLLLVLVMVLRLVLLVVGDWDVSLADVLVALVGLSSLDVVMGVLAVVLLRVLLLIVSQAGVSVIIRLLVVFDGTSEGGCRKRQDDQCYLESRRTR